MRSRMKLGIGLMVAVAATLVLAALPSLAQAPARPGPEGRPAARHHRARGPDGDPVRQLARLHKELGKYYLLDGQYAAALEHFLALTELEPPAVEGRRGRRGARQQGEAYLMAAVCSYLVGDSETAVALAEAGRSSIPERPEARRDENPFDRFLEDPATFSERFAGGAAQLEQRLLEIEARLSENDAQ